jgi:hypothetical protein
LSDRHAQLEAESRYLEGHPWADSPGQGASTGSVWIVRGTDDPTPVGVLGQLHVPIDPTKGVWAESVWKIEEDAIARASALANMTPAEYRELAAIKPAWGNVAQGARVYRIPLPPDGKLHYQEGTAGPQTHVYANPDVQDALRYSGGSPQVLVDLSHLAGQTLDPVASHTFSDPEYAAYDPQGWGWNPKTHEYEAIPGQIGLITPPTEHDLHQQLSPGFGADTHQDPLTGPDHWDADIGH